MSTPLLADVLRAVAAEEPEREAYVHDGKSATYAWLDRVADGFATTLLERGVRRGDRVCLLLPSSIKFAACSFGAARVGAIIAAVDLDLPVADQASIVTRTEPAVTVVGDGARLPTGVDPGRVLPVERLKEAFAAGPPGVLPPVAASDLACIVWAVGTAGTPRGAVYDHEAMAAISRNLGDLAAPHDRLLFNVPFAHVGYLAWLYAFTVRRTTLVVPPTPWTPAAALGLVESGRPTAVNGLPAQWSQLLDADNRLDGAHRLGAGATHLRVVAIGPAAPPELISAARAAVGVPVLNGYWTPELGVGTTTRTDDPDDVLTTTVGRPGPEVELRVVNGDGDAASVDEIGDVVCRSPAMMRAYWRDPERTRTVIDDDGFLHTGDRGRVRRDGALELAGARPPDERRGDRISRTAVEAAGAAPTGTRAPTGGRR